MSEIVIFEDASQPVEVRLEGESDLGSLRSQMAELFDTTTDNIGLHLKNIYSEGELAESATTEEFSVVRQEGKRQVRRRLKHYDLDAVISVGYRVSSHRATRFRQWATRVLREHLTQGYSLNEHRLAQQGLSELEQAVELLGQTLTRQELVSDLGQEVVSLILGYARTWRLLQDYDEGRAGPRLQGLGRPGAFWRWKKPGAPWMLWPLSCATGARPASCSRATGATGSPSILSATLSRACSARRCTRPARSAPLTCCIS